MGGKQGTPPRPTLNPPIQAHGSPTRGVPARGDPLVQRPGNGLSRQHQIARPVLNPSRQPSWADLEYLKLQVRGVPRAWGTWDMYQLLSIYGHLSRIELLERPGDHSRAGYVTFKPPPKDATWIRKGRIAVRTSDGVPQTIEISVANTPSRQENVRPGDNLTSSHDHIGVPAARMDVGVLEQPHSMLGMFEALPCPNMPIEMGLSKRFHEMTLVFPWRSKQEPSGSVDCEYKVTIDLAQMRQIHKCQDEQENTILTFSFDLPPLFWRKTNDIKSTHHSNVLEWKDSRLWFRQTGIDRHPSPSNAITQLQKEAVSFDVGQWLTYRLVIGKATASSVDFNAIGRLLSDHNVTVSQMPVALKQGSVHSMHSWTGDSQRGVGDAARSTGISALDELSAAPAAQLAFLVRYQLEVCISQGLLLGCNITSSFLYRLLAMQPEVAIKLLEKVADDKKHYYDPMDIVQLQRGLILTKKKDRPQCTMIPAATMTPSTVYFATRVMETSNRVVRKYRAHEDRFLRVKFTDERWKGKIRGRDESMSEVLTHVHRTMRNGIKIGDRFYEFLAFGNAQFKEHGAYFFAPTGSRTAADIRRWMGDFRGIVQIAKYAARLGQSLSTTKAIPYTGSGITAEKIEEITRNGHVFSDGVGKISPFLARIIAHEHNFHHSDNDFPSVFQFRMAGCKGVVAVDPELKGKVIQYRDSQKKFEATDFSLGICRVSRFAGAHLNIQLIAVLEALGVQPWPFVEKMTQNVKLLADAMTDEQIALQQLYKKVDGNGTAVILAEMIYDGFMSARDPFFYSCLRLWRAWWIKYLKEKAKIPIDDGAFVLGCIDETATLKGHFDGVHSADTILRDPASLPEIFLQIDDPDYSRATGRYKVITGICMVARNPSLHAGDIRIVRAVDVAALHHLKNCVVFPQTGDRPVPNMCSGGDLDGDDYLVMWDPDIMPPAGEWNHEAMDYTGPKAKEVDGEVPVNDIISFFVTHMKNENLGQIAVAHRFWADRRPEGVKSEECIALANLHSMAVDYAKTGVPAIFPEELRFKGPKPHWSERQPCYRSNKAIGQLYNAVRLVDFHPEWETPFDARILDSYCPDEQLLGGVLEIKQRYDGAIRRLMAQYGIRNEFEVWTTYVLAHNQDNDYKFAEDMAEKVECVKQHFQEVCCEKAGTTSQRRDWSKMVPFIAAMYIATAREVGDAREAKQETRLVGGQSRRTQMTPENMPFMSFPWLFPRELGLIAKKQGDLIRPPGHVNAPRRIPPHRSNVDLLGPDVELEELPEVVVSKIAFPGVRVEESQDETVLDPPALSSLSGQSIIGDDPIKEDVSCQSSSVSVAADVRHPGLGGPEPDRPPSHPVRREPSHINHDGDLHSRTAGERDARVQASSVDVGMDVAEQHEGAGDDEVGGEEVVILGPPTPSAREALDKLMRSS